MKIRFALLTTPTQQYNERHTKNQKPKTRTMATPATPNNNSTSLTDMDAYVATASNDQFILLMFIATVLGLGKGGVPGFATIATAATVATAPPGGLGFAVALQVPILAMIDVYAAWLHADQLDWPTIRLLLPLSFVGMAVGQQLDQHMTDGAARVLVGVILLAILVLRVHKPVVAAVCPPKQKKKMASRVDDDVEQGERKAAATTTGNTIKSASSNSSVGWACVVGLVGGMATMLTNSMGPILNVYLLSVQGLSPAAYIGTRAMFFCFLNLGKLPMRFVSGTLGWPMMPLATVLGLVSVVGVYCAKPIMLSMNETTFVKLELSVVALAGVRLLWMGLHSTN